MPEQPSDLPRAEALPSAIIYCRVSSTRQLTEGDGLGGQETTCRAYAGSRGYPVEDVFTDGISGGTENRPGFLSLLAFLDDWRTDGREEIVVVVDDLKRFARDVAIHFDLKSEIVRRGARLESPNFRFEDTPEGKFVETMIAAQAELERNQNKRQVKRRMWARLEQGYWAFHAPPGYQVAPHPVHKRWLVPDERATAAREALEGFAVGRFPRQMDAVRFLESASFYPPGSATSPSVRLTQFADMLRNPLYAGLVGYPPWDVSLREGKHEAIISVATFNAIQDRLATNIGSRPPALMRTDTSDDLPLRGMILCAGCARRLTGSMSRGKMGRLYPYYHCTFRPCPFYAKTIPAGHLHDEVFEILKAPAMKDQDFATMRAEAIVWQRSRRARRSDRRLTALSEIKAIDEQIEEWADEVRRFREPSMLAAVERKVAALAKRRAALEPELSATHSSDGDIDAGTLFDAVEPMLKTPYEIWKSGGTKRRRVVVRLAFQEPIAYRRGEGFGTPDYALPYRIPTYLNVNDSTLVDKGRATSDTTLDMAWKAAWETLLLWQKDLFQ